MQRRRRLGGGEVIIDPGYDEEMNLRNTSLLNELLHDIQGPLRIVANSINRLSRRLITKRGVSLDSLYLTMIGILSDMISCGGGVVMEGLGGMSLDSRVKTESNTTLNFVV